jgi:hypothetical protein
MDDKFPLKVAVDQAWTVHLATRTDVDAADPRRCSLERYVSERWEAGESDPEEFGVLRPFILCPAKVGELVRAGWQALQRR